MHQAYKLVEAMKEITFDGASGAVSLGGCSWGIRQADEGGADENGDRLLNVDFLNVVDGDVWPVVAHYDVRKGNLSLLGNITWMGGSKSKVSLEPLAHERTNTLNLNVIF